MSVVDISSRDDTGAWAIKVRPNGLPKDVKGAGESRILVVTSRRWEVRGRIFRLRDDDRFIAKFMHRVKAVLVTRLARRLCPVRMPRSAQASEESHPSAETTRQ